MQVDTKGSFGGLGIEVTQQDGFVKVVSPMDDTPAYKAGVLAGDFITFVDDKPMLGLTLAEAVEIMRGPVGSSIKLTIVREGLEEPIELQVTRAVIKLTAAKVRIDNDVVIMRVTTSIGSYFSNMLDQTMSWKDAEQLRSDWNGPFALKGIVSVEDAKKAVDIGCDGVIVSNHGGRQLDGAASPFDQLAKIVDAVGDKTDVICEGGIQRGTHVLKALSVGAKACAGGRLYLYALAAAGQKGVEKALSNLQREMERDMKLMGVTRIDQLSRRNLNFN